MPDSRKKNILLITRYFIPFFPSIGGVMRIYTLAQFLAENGYDVHILSRRGKFYGYFGYENVVKMLNIQYTGRYLFYSEKTSNFKALRWISNRTSGFLKKICIPDENIFKVRSFTKAAEKIITENSINNVFISSPPHGMQIIGLRLKKKFEDRINLIVDYRDSWNTTGIFRHFTMTGFYISKKIEKKVLEVCDSFTYVSQPMLSKIEKLHSISLSDKAHLVMNGFLRSNITIANEKASAGSKILIGYFGSLGSGKRAYRSIDNLIHVLQEDHDLADKFEFYFYGSINMEKSKLENLTNIHVYPAVNHEIALAKMAEMDFLLMVHSDTEGSDEVITGKFFEYVSVRKPIICLAPPDMEGGRLVREHGIGIHLNIHDKESLKSGLAMLGKPYKGQYYNGLDTIKFSREFQYTRLLDILR